MSEYCLAMKPEVTSNKCKLKLQQIQDLDSGDVPTGRLGSAGDWVACSEIIAMSVSKPYNYYDCCYYRGFGGCQLQSVLAVVPSFRTPWICNSLLDDLSMCRMCRPCRMHDAEVKTRETDKETRQEAADRLAD